MDQKRRRIADVEERDALGEGYDPDCEDIGFFAKNAITKKMCLVLAWKFDVMGNIKKQIETKLGISRDDQIITFNGVECRDDRTIAWHRIQPADHVLVNKKTSSAAPVAPSTASSRVTVPELQIFVNIANDKTIMLHVKTTDTIDNVKSQIHTIVARKDLKKWSLWGRGVRLCHGTSTMSSLQIQNMEVLEYKPPPPRGSVGSTASSSSAAPVAPTAASSTSTAPVAPTAASSSSAAPVTPPSLRRLTAGSAELADPAAEVERLRALIFQLGVQDFFYGVSAHLNP
jgi:hypothetical protein